MTTQDPTEKCILSDNQTHFRFGRMSGRFNQNPLFCCPLIGQLFHTQAYEDLASGKESRK